MTILINLKCVHFYETDIKNNFRPGVFNRNKCTCKVCGFHRNVHTLDTHHIYNREMKERFELEKIGFFSWKFIINAFGLNGDIETEDVHARDLYGRDQVQIKTATSFDRDGTKKTLIIDHDGGISFFGDPKDVIMSDVDRISNMMNISESPELEDLRYISPDDEINEQDS